MKKIFLTTSIAVLTAIRVFSQNIDFDVNTTWSEILEKARTENRYIFVDAMATWCLPCKKMEQEVYTDRKVASFANANFIAVKVQMDRTPGDSSQTKAWYRTAEMLERKYQVRAFPTFLFFSPDGKIVHRETGFRDTLKFGELMARALDPKTQKYGRYHQLVSQYERGQKDFGEMPFLVNTSRTLRESELATKIAADYIHNYLMRLPANELYTAENLRFIAGNLKLADQQVFGVFYPDGTKVDSVIKGFSSSVVAHVLTQDVINPILYSDGEFIKPKHGKPDWAAIRKQIAKSYAKVNADSMVNEAKVRFYTITEDWERYADAYLTNLEQYDWVDQMKNRFQLIGGLNNALYNMVFKKVTDHGLLKRAAEQQLKAINNPFSVKAGSTEQKKKQSLANLIDTYANLLYKAGKVKKAIIWQKKAVEDAKGISEFAANLDKMQKGVPTW